MKPRWIALALTLLLLLGTGLWLFAVPSVSAGNEIPTSEQAIARGQYLFTAGGCISCHRDEENPEIASGGLGIESPFGTFYAPNITPDPATGIGAWQAEDFLRAMKHGRSPSGSFYFPAFPYRAYAGLTDADVLDLAGYLMSLPAVQQQAPAHEVPGWLRRFMMAGWNRLADFAE
ncbi:MAG: cytochrome c, partial [Gammaproteobacteria bacterium]